MKYLNRQEALLYLLIDIGGEGELELICSKIPNYWNLKDSDLEIEKKTGKPKFWKITKIAASRLKSLELMEFPKKGYWKITESGKKYINKEKIIKYPNNNINLPDFQNHIIVLRVFESYGHFVLSDGLNETLIVGLSPTELSFGEDYTRALAIICNQLKYKKYQLISSTSGGTDDKIYSIYIFQKE